MNRNPPHHMSPTAYERKDCPRKVSQCKSWVEGHFTYRLCHSQDPGFLIGKIPAFLVQARLSRLQSCCQTQYLRTAGKCGSGDSKIGP